MKKTLLIILFPCSLIAQTNYAETLGKYMRAITDVRGFSGAVMVTKQNKVLLKQGYGMADREWNIANTADTKFRIGSITKQFTASCILQLSEQGKLSLDDKLSKFYPDFPRGDSVTIHMLLNHTSGIASYTGIPGFMNDKAPLVVNRDSIIGYFKYRPYDFSPGERFLYNNSGYFLLGDIIEKVSGTSYSNYLRQNILDKLGMTNTGVDEPDSILSMRARGYSKSGKQYVNARVISMVWPFSAGAVYSTLDDLYKWDRALYGTSVLSTTSKKKMFTPGKQNYGYGIVIDSLEKHLRISHSGGIPGFSAYISRFIDDDICIIVFSNDEYNTAFVSIALADILFDVAVQFPYVHKEIKMDPSLLDKFVGKYAGGPTITVIKRDGKLYRQAVGTPDIELKPESATKFFYADESDRQLEFELDKSGRVSKVWFMNSGQKGEIKKIE